MIGNNERMPSRVDKVEWSLLGDPMDGSLPHRSELIPTFVSRKARNGSDLPVGHF